MDFAITLSDILVTLYFWNSPRRIWILAMFSISKQGMVDAKVSQLQQKGWEGPTKLISLLSHLAKSLLTQSLHLTSTLKLHIKDVKDVSEIRKNKIHNLHKKGTITIKGYFKLLIFLPQKSAETFTTSPVVSWKNNTIFYVC